MSEQTCKILAISISAIAFMVFFALAVASTDDESCEPEADESCEPEADESCEKAKVRVKQGIPVVVCHHCRSTICMVKDDGNCDVCGSEYKITQVSRKN